MKKPTSTSSSLLLAALLLLATAILSTAARQLASNNDQPYGFPYFGMPWYGGNSGFLGGGGPHGWTPWSNDYFIPTTICKERGPCYNKKLSCPAKCYRSWSNNGRNGNSGGSSGGCTLDCRRCASYC